MEKQFQSLNNSSDNLFDGVYEIRPSKVVGIIISVINIFLISPLLYFVIWYEKFGSNHNRSLINQFATSGCWTALAYCFLVQVPELIIALKGALGSPFCYLHLLLKNVLGIQYTLQAAAIPFVKYLHFCLEKSIWAEWWFLVLFLQHCSHTSGNSGTMCFPLFAWKEFLHFLCVQWWRCKTT